MRQLFQDDTSEAVILVDATNAFNSLNREAALHNIKYFPGNSSNQHIQLIQ